MSTEASARVLSANQTSELASNYGKLSSTHGKVTTVLIIFRNTMWELFEGKGIVRSMEKVEKWKEKSSSVQKSAMKYA